MITQIEASSFYEKTIIQEQRLFQVGNHPFTRSVQYQNTLSNMIDAENMILSDTKYLWKCVPRCGATTSTSTDEIDTASRSSSSSNTNHVPSVTLNENMDMMYNKYAACLAATEGLRRKRDTTIQQNLSKSSNCRNNNNNIMKEYITNASKIIEDMGLSVSDFNSIGRQVCNDPALKQKVTNIDLVLQFFLVFPYINIVAFVIAVFYNRYFKRFACDF